MQSSQISVPPELNNLLGTITSEKHRKVNLYHLLPKILNSLDLEALLVVLDLYSPDGGVNSYIAKRVLEELGAKDEEIEHFMNHLRDSNGRLEAHDLLVSFGILNRWV